MLKNLDGPTKKKSVPLRKATATTNIGGLATAIAGLFITNIALALAGLVVALAALSLDVLQAATDQTGVNQEQRISNLARDALKLREAVQDIRSRL